MKRVEKAAVKEDGKEMVKEKESLVTKEGEKVAVKARFEVADMDQGQEHVEASRLATTKSEHHPKSSSTPRPGKAATSDSKMSPSETSPPLWASWAPWSSLSKQGEPTVPEKSITESERQLPWPKPVLYPLPPKPPTPLRDEEED